MLQDLATNSFLLSPHRRKQSQDEAKPRSSAPDPPPAHRHVQLPREVHRLPPLSTFRLFLVVFYLCSRLALSVRLCCFFKRLLNSLQFQCVDCCVLSKVERCERIEIYHSNGNLFFFFFWSFSKQNILSLRLRLRLRSLFLNREPKQTKHIKLIRSIHHTSLLYSFPTLKPHKTNKKQNERYTNSSTGAASTKTPNKQNSFSSNAYTRCPPSHSSL